ncbi:hypothetical protein Gogos_000913 [Gossypium gossypioides]|uniref:Uncharacterized protein n=1 Tax=Gossypium gossypioides TaxID=34282 RepID=A0A7J9CU80_GOSGO|nr:hypothetical protein [Gossypium gossypioides]
MRNFRAFLTVSNLFNEGAMTKLSFILIAWKLLKAFSEALPLFQILL